METSKTLPPILAIHILDFFKKFHYFIEEF